MALWIKCKKGQLINLDFCIDIFIKKYTDDAFHLYASYPIYNHSNQDIEIVLMEAFSSREKAEEKMDKIWSLFVMHDRAWPYE